MGREAVCHCEWGDESGECKVLLETSELIVRGAFRRKAAIASITEISVHGDTLRCRVGMEAVSLQLGARTAQSWAKKLSLPPVTLAAKLGVVPGIHMLLLGNVESEALRAVLEGYIENKKAPELIFLCSESKEEFKRGLERATAFAIQPPVWVVYRKGARSELGEATVRGEMRSLGLIDTKVAAVDEVYTALRFKAKS